MIFLKLLYYVLLIVVSSLEIQWNYRPLTIRNYEKKGDLKWEGNIWDGKYYSNFPDRISKLFPMHGTQDINTNEATELEIRQDPVIAFMITKDSWFSVPIDGWEKVDTGKFLGPDSNDINIYEKFLEPGTYYIDNNSSYYLFTKGIIFYANNLKSIVHIKIQLIVYNK